MVCRSFDERGENATLELTRRKVTSHSGWVLVPKRAGAMRVGLWWSYWGKDHRAAKRDYKPIINPTRIGNSATAPP